MATDETPLERWRRIDRAKSYRPITRGPHKGQLVRKTKSEFQRDRIADNEAWMKLDREQDSKFTVRFDRPKVTPARDRHTRKPNYCTLVGLVTVFLIFGLSELTLLAIDKQLSRFALILAYWADPSLRLLRLETFQIKKAL